MVRLSREAARSSDFFGWVAAGTAESISDPQKGRRCWSSPLLYTKGVMARSVRKYNKASQVAAVRNEWREAKSVIPPGVAEPANIRLLTIVVITHIITLQFGGKP